VRTYPSDPTGVWNPFMGAVIRRYLSIGATIVFTACSQGPETGPAATDSEQKAPITTASTDSAGIRILGLSHTLEEVAAGETHAEIVEPDLLVGETDDVEGIWFGAISDVTSLTGGAFAVLDHMENRLVVVDSSGRIARSIGREGEGPGEFKQPWAVARVGSSLVVRQNMPVRTFTVFGEDGDVLATAPAQPEGDWNRPRFRFPRFRMTGYPMGPEDVTRRLRPFDTQSFVHMLQVDETEPWDFENPTEFDAIPTFLIRYGLDGLVIDTLAELRGPPTYLQGMQAGQTFFFTQPLFSGAPVWATGEGWYAIGHGDSTDVVVRNTDREVFLRVRPPRRRRPVSHQDKVEAANWVMTAAVLYTPRILDWIKDDPSELEWGQNRFINDPDNGIHFADSIPLVSAAFGSGRCLFLSGFSAADWSDGTSLTWLVIDVLEAEVISTIRLRPPPHGTLPPERDFLPFSQHGAAVRDIDGSFAFTTLRMPDGAPAVERYPLSLPCKG